MGRLDQKVCIITGAGSGIGKRTAELFAQEGAVVVAADLDGEAAASTASGLEAQGGRALAVRADISQAVDCRALLSAALSEFGRVDVLVNNAGINDRAMGVIRTGDALWEKVLAVNLTGTFQMCRAGVEAMLPRGGGVIVNVSSVGGVYGCAGSSYSASKAGVIGLTKNIAMQYAGRGIRCNAVCPGSTVTPLLSEGDRDQFDADMMEASGKHFDRTIPPLRPEEQASTILFFACDESRAITGQVLVVDGGRFL